MTNILVSKIIDGLEKMQRCADEMMGEWDYVDEGITHAGFHWALHMKDHIRSSYNKHLRSYLELKEILLLCKSKSKKTKL